MVTVYWDREGVILLDVMQRGITINSDMYISMLTKMQKCFQCVRPDKNLGEMLLQHNARPHTSNTTWEAVTQTGWTMLLRPTYSPGLAPSDFHLFRHLKDAVRGRKLRWMMVWLAL
jgi:histone-lysine N-methyltransferase SETMAR